MDMQNVSNLTIPEGQVRTIHDENSRLLWGRVNYDTKYKGDTTQQTYTGKNLLNSLNGFTKAYISNQGGIIYDSGGTNALFNYIDVSSSTTYAFSQHNPTVIQNVGIAYFDAGKIFISRQQVPNVTSTTFTTPNDCKFVRIWVYRSGGVTQSILEQAELQFERNNSATSYEPFVGGTASPSPDYPQPINVVTGEQTVTISDGVNSETFSVSLGSVELAKIGNYQDYIYKSGDDWYVHKVTGKAMFDGTENWTYDSTIPRIYLSAVALSDLDISAVFPNSSNDLPKGFTNRFIGKTFTNFYSNSQSNGFAMSTVGRNFQVGYKKWQSQSDAEADVNGLVWFYALATPTDTKITDSTLIGQLNAVHEWLTRYGYNATVTGNLPIIVNRTNL